MAELPRPPILLDIVEEHFEEVDFLWELRENVVFAPDWSLEDLAAHEERAEAHLDGLRAAGAHAVDLARPALLGEERSAATAAALTLMITGVPELQAEVVLALAAAPPEARVGIRVGLRHSDVGGVVPRLQNLAAQADHRVRIAALDVLAFHRQPPPPGLAELLFKADPAFRPLLYGALGRFGGPWSVDPLMSALESGGPPLQRAALEASARLGTPDLTAICRRAASRSENPSPVASEFLGVLGDPQDLPLLQNTLGVPALARAALAGLGAMGRVAAVPVLIEAMRREDLTQAAGAAFTRITGATDIQASQPLPPPPDLPEEELDFHDPVFPCDSEKARAWWEKEKGRFAENGRWQAGLDVSKAPLGAAFDRLPLETRRDVYLSVRAGGSGQAPDLELEKRARLQVGTHPGS